MQQWMLIVWSKFMRNWEKRLDRICSLTSLSKTSDCLYDFNHDNSLSLTIIFGVLQRIHSLGWRWNADFIWRPNRGWKRRVMIRLGCCSFLNEQEYPKYCMQFCCNQQWIDRFLSLGLILNWVDLQLLVAKPALKSRYQAFSLNNWLKGVALICEYLQQN